MRAFRDGDVITVEPFAPAAFPIVKDLITDRGGFDKIQQAGGFITARAGSAPDANALPVPKPDADLAMDAAAASAAARAWPSARTRARCSSSPESFPPRPDAAGAGRARQARARDGLDDGCARFRQLHQPIRVQRRVPETHHADFIARMNRDYLGASVRAAFKAEPASTGGGAG